MSDVKIKRSLGFWMLTALVIGNAIGSGVFLLPASLAKFGTISIGSWILTGIGTLFLAAVFARLGTLIPKTGGPYAFCHEAYGDFVGFQVAYNYWIALCVGNAAIAVAFTSYLSVFFPFLINDHIATLTVTLVLVWGLTLINIYGVKEAGIVQLATTILKLIPLVLIAVIGLAYIHPANLQDFNISHESNFAALSKAATLTMWAFIGFESATVPADNVIDPKRNIPRATMFGTVIVAIVYIIGTITVMGIVPMSQLAHSTSPFADAAQAMFGRWGADFIALGAIIATLGTLNGWIMLQGQVPLAAADDKLFPAVFGKMTKRGTPHIGLIISSLIITVLLVMRYSASLVDQFTFIITLAVLAQVIPYLYTTAAELLLNFTRSEEYPPKKLGLTAFIAIVAFIYAFWIIAGAGLDIVYYGSLLFLTGIPIYAYMKFKG